MDFGLVLFLVTLEILRAELRRVTWQDLTTEVGSISTLRLSLALLLTCANYAVLTTYDRLAVAAIGVQVSLRRVVATSLLAYAVANNVGFSMLSGAAIRYRFYTRWGLSAQNLVNIVAFCSVTFWLGLCALGGLSLLVAPPPALRGTLATSLVPVAAAGLLLLPVAYLVAAVVRRAPVRVRGFQFSVPSPRLAMAQLGASMGDWVLAGGVLYVLLPPSDLSFLRF